jgi:Na+-transporting NADH:ubiquinone oxidoreductase subunit B
MKRLRTLLDNKRSHFGKGGKLERWFPLYSAVDTFLYTPGETTASAPHVRDALNIKRIMIILICALIPSLFMALFNTGLQANLAMRDLGAASLTGLRQYVLSGLGTGLNPERPLDNLIHGALYVLPLLITCILVSGFWEALFAIIRKEAINESFFVVPLMFTLVLPPTIPFWQVALGVSFGVVIGKEIYGGFGRNILNPVLVGYAFLFFAYPARLSGDTVWVAVDGVTKATPLAELKEPAVNISVSWMDAFLGVIPGSMGETSALACLLGAVVLVVTGTTSWRIIFGIIVGMVSLSLLFNLIGSDTNPMFNISPLWHFVLGGFAFGTVFLATDPVSGPMTQTGQLYYGLLIGILAVLIRVVNPAFTEGVMLAILFGNVFAPVIDRLIIHRHLKRRLMRDAS